MEIGSGLLDVFGFANYGPTDNLRLGIGVDAQARLTENVAAFLQAKAWYEASDWQAEALAGMRIRW